MTVFLVTITMLVTPSSMVTASLAMGDSYIVMGETTGKAIELVRAYGGAITSELDIINAVGAILPPSAVENLSKAAGIISVTPNHEMQTNSLDYKPKGNPAPDTDYPEVVGANAVWAAGFTGNDIAVAMIDTGIIKHPGLVKGTNGKGNRVIGWADFIDGSNNKVDPNGHGTHTAGVIANSEVGLDGSYNGIAPDVDLVVARVSNAEGFATYEKVIQGIQWIVKTKQRYNTRVMNFSMSAPVHTPYWADPVNLALMAAWQSGIVVVAAAGNTGPDALSVGVPGNNPYIITVGAFTDAYTPADWSDDYIPSFSSAGPTHDGFIKPDLVAPGAHMLSLMDPNAVLAKLLPPKKLSAYYSSMSGTSQAAAVVSGISALMLSYDPSLTPSQVKSRLRATAIPQFNEKTGQPIYSVYQQGAGRVFAPLAVFSQIVDDSANSDMDIAADLANQVHYMGFGFRDDQGIYRLYGDDGRWAAGSGVWDGVTSPLEGGAWIDGRFWSDGGFWGDGGDWTQSEFWTDGRFWSDGGFWADSGFWSNGSFWGEGGFWNNGGFWADGRFWSDSGLWTDGRFWSDGGFWADAGGFFADGRFWSDDVFWTEGRFWSDGGFWSDGRFWSDGGFWSDGRFWSDGGFWTDGRFWSDGGFWTDGRFWSDGGFWADTELSTED
ncbi:MAG: S8 family peptidase [Anaerolineales bacterium]|nr:S8 family peptidase [Anaerolineales bacterium]